MKILIFKRKNEEDRVVAGRLTNNEYLIDPH